MDDESTQLLREIRDLQKKQLALLETAMLPPWLRWRFSLRSLLVVMTVVALGLGSLIFLRTLRSGPAPIPVPPRAAPIVR
jgi:hypothetical protein